MYAIPHAPGWSRLLCGSEGWQIDDYDGRAAAIVFVAVKACMAIAASVIVAAPISSFFSSSQACLADG